MKELHTISTADAPAAIGPYSQAVRIFRQYGPDELIDRSHMRHAIREKQFSLRVVRR